MIMTDHYFAFQCCLLKTFANSLDSDQAGRFLSGSKLFDTLIVFLKDIFEKLNFEEKKSADNRKACKIFPACKDLTK